MNYAAKTVMSITSSGEWNMMWCSIRFRVQLGNIYDAHMEKMESIFETKIAAGRKKNENLVGNTSYVNFKHVQHFEFVEYYRNLNDKT